MNKVLFVGLLLACGGIAFAAGVAIGRHGRTEIPPLQPPAKTETKEVESDRSQALVAELDGFGTVLAEKEGEMRDLESELAEVMAKLPPPLTPEEEKRQKEEEEKRKKEERWQARHKKAEELRAKILQRRDRALRTQGLEELAALLQSKDSEELLLGLMAAPCLSSIPCDRERFKPYVLAALASEDGEIRNAGLGCLYTFCTPEEHLDFALRMIDDPSPEIRGSLPWRIFWGTQAERKEETLAAMRKLLHDENKEVRRGALEVFGHNPLRAQEVEEAVEEAAIEMSRDPEEQNRMMQWLSRRDNISAKAAQRLVGMYGEGGARDYGIDWLYRRLSDDAKPIAIEFCLRLLRDSIEPYERSSALRALREMGDASVQAELEVVSRSDDAEGLEKELGEAIEHLRQKGGGQR